MADPRTTLEPRFEAALRAAFGDEHAKTDPVLRRSDRADYQADVAMALAKKVGKPPRDVAKLIMDHLDLSDIADKVEVAGPGFINVTLSAAFLGAAATLVARDPRAGVVVSATPETVVVDYSAPNVAKEMHVGHVRSTVIGDSLARVLETLGHTVLRQNHVGDWGTPFGMLIEHLLDLGEEAALATSITDLDAFYKQAREKFDGEPAFAERSRQRVVLLQGGDEQTLTLWKRFTDASKRYFGAVYEKLGVKLKEEHVRGESFYNPMLAGIVTELEGKGLTEVSDGAVCVFPAGFTNKEGTRLPLIVRKQDGGYGYAATDLAAIRSRTQDLHATRLLYVVGAPQQQHFAMVFSVAKAAGWLKEPARAEHVAFGSILGPDKKMFKTRAGGTVKLAELLDEAVQRAAAAVAEKNPELDEATRAEVARKIGVGERRPDPGRAGRARAGARAPRPRRGGDIGRRHAAAASPVHVPLRRGDAVQHVLRPVLGAQGGRRRDAALAPAPLLVDRPRPGDRSRSPRHRGARADVTADPREPRARHALGRLGAQQLGGVDDHRPGRGGR
jgi:arginyl-tRNA synthetase